MYQKITFICAAAIGLPSAAYFYHTSKVSDQAQRAQLQVEADHKLGSFPLDHQNLEQSASETPGWSHHYQIEYSNHAHMDLFNGLQPDQGKWLEIRTNVRGELILSQLPQAQVDRLVENPVKQKIGQHWFWARIPKAQTKVFAGTMDKPELELALAEARQNGG